MLVRDGYKQSLDPDLGNQLLILMIMLAGAGPDADRQPATDELRIAAFKCISTVLEQLAKTSRGLAIFEDHRTKNVVDQLGYLLLEVIAEGAAEDTQLAALNTLRTLLQLIKSRAMLASLLPRTVSSLVKALKESTKGKRTQKVLAANLDVLRCILYDVLNDEVAHQFDEILDKPWLAATAGQVKTALAQAVKLRKHDGLLVRRALQNLCLMVIEHCAKSLSESTAMMLETLVVLAASPEDNDARLACRRLLSMDPSMADLLRESFSSWSSSLPRLMQSRSEDHKRLVLSKLSTTINIMDTPVISFEALDQAFAPNLVNAVTSLLHDASSVSILPIDNPADRMDLISSSQAGTVSFEPVILNHESQKEVVTQLRNLIAALTSSVDASRLSRYIVDMAAESTGDTQLAAIWLALHLLQRDRHSLDLDDILDMAESVNSRRTLLSDLHAFTYPYLQSAAPIPTLQEAKLIALSLESLTAYAETFPSTSYRPELAESLYPVLALVASPSSLLRSHALTALHGLSSVCQYSSVSELLVSNSDYLVNAIAWNLNTYSLTPQAPQILKLMVHLCGAKLIPYLDDLVQSIFAALDTYHEYPEWVELLFDALKAIVDVSVKDPSRAITQSKDQSMSHIKPGYKHTTVDDILEDLRARKRRKLTEQLNEEQFQPVKAPHRPWTSSPETDTTIAADAPTNNLEDILKDDMTDNDEQPLQPMKPSEDEEIPKLTKSHDLLLSITRATASHLTSPSPQVRHVLLDLVKTITPLLATDENSFLPLVNTVWPTLVNRLFGARANDGNDTDELSYNVSAAADTIATLCKGAGDFMASRIEEIAEKLIRTFKLVVAQVRPKKDQKAASAVMSDQHRSNINGTVDLHITPSLTALSPSTDATQHQIASHSKSLRTSQTQILAALLNLTMSILDHVKVTLDTGDELCKLLLPFLDGTKDADRIVRVKECCKRWNEEMVRLWEAGYIEV